MMILEQELLGRSRSGIETCLVLPQLDVAFDMGFCPFDAIKARTVLVTHGHPDHTLGLVQHAAIRDLMGSKPSRFVVPVHLVEPIEQMFRTAEQMQDDEIRREVIGFSPGDELPLKKGLVVRSFPTDHTLPSQGYLVVSKKQKLKPEYVGTPGPEIGRLRREGVDVTDTVEVIEVAYPGDTRATVLDTVPELQQARILLMEATFVTSDLEPSFASDRGHTHLCQHAERAERYGNEAVVFVHFSMRHSEDQVREAVGALPEPLRGKAVAFL